MRMRVMNEGRKGMEMNRRDSGRKRVRHLQTYLKDVLWNTFRISSTNWRAIFIIFVIWIHSYFYILLFNIKF
jgi:hypothetical protein